jgi:hypothetical protein
MHLAFSDINQKIAAQTSDERNPDERFTAWRPVRLLVGGQRRQSSHGGHPERGLQRRRCEPDLQCLRAGFRDDQRADRRLCRVHRLGRLPGLRIGRRLHDTLRASARVGFSTLDPGGFIGTNSLLGSASGGARYTDTLVIDVAGRTGEIVDLVFETAMHGALSAVADYTYVYGVADANLAVNVNGVNVRVGRDAKSFGNSVSSDFNPGRVQIELGSPFAVSAELQTRARLFRTTGSTQFYSGDVVADFFNSGGITSFTLFEAGAGGALIPDWNLSSESGQFGFYAAAVPAPGAAWLLATGLVALAAKRRARAADRTRAA